MTQREFFAALDHGYFGSQSSMPPRGRDPNVAPYYDELWSFLRARVTGDLPAGPVERACVETTALELDAHADPRGARRAGADEVRVVEVVAEHVVRFAEHAERLVLLVEQVVDVREEARALAEAVLGADADSA